MSSELDSESELCEEFSCTNDATHVFHDDLGAKTDVCDDHAALWPEEMLEVKA